MCTEELVQPLLPDPRGPVSDVVIGLLGERLPTQYLTRIQLPLGIASRGVVDFGSGVVHAL